MEDDGKITDYTYDKNGNRKTQKVVKGEEVIAEIEYLYNSLGRLVETAETRTDMSEDSNYKYDSNGNQIEVAITTTNITPATAETVEEKVVHNSVVKYDFNGKNQMTHSESAGGRSAEYKYYFNSLRSEKADTKFIYSGKQVLAEVSPDSENINVYGNALLFTIATQITTTKTEIPNPDYIKPVDKEEIPPVNQIAGVTETNKASETSESNVEPTNETTTNPTSESKVEPTNEITTNPTSESKVVDTESETIIVEEKTRETQNLIYNFNGHGDVVRLSNENGVKLNTYKYDAFGNITEKVEAVSNTFFYSGYEYDEETGLYYLRTRYYNPKTARFTSEDTFNGWYEDPLSLNKYTYAHNNPISYNDPDGMSILSAIKNGYNKAKNYVVEKGKKILNSIKEAFTPSKPESSGSGNASYSTSGGGYDHPPYYIGTDEDALRKAEEAGSLTSGYTTDDIWNLIDPDGDGRYDERWANGQYPNPNNYNEQHGASYDRSFIVAPYESETDIHIRALLEAKNSNTIVVKPVTISGTFGLGGVAYVKGYAYSPSGDIIHFETLSAQLGLTVPGLSVTGGTTTTNFTDINDLQGVGYLQGGNELGYGLEISESVSHAYKDDKVLISETKSVGLSYGAAVGVYGPGISYTWLDSNTNYFDGNYGELKYKMKGYEIVE